MHRIFHFLAIFILLTFSCSTSKISGNEFKSSFYTAKVLDKNYLFINNIGGHTIGGDGVVSAKEKLFSIKLPNNLYSSSFEFGSSFIHRFKYYDAGLFMIIDSRSTINIERQDSISKTEFLAIIDTIRSFHVPSFSNSRKSLKNRTFGIVTKGSFILCYMNIKKKDVAKFKNAFDSFTEIK